MLPKAGAGRTGMGGRQFIPVRIAVLTVSDSRMPEDDRSGDVLVGRLTEAGHILADRALVRDDRTTIARAFRAWAADDHIDVILSTGGTGVTGRDVSPEALADVQEKSIPGFGELFRYLSYQKIGTSTIQSRCVAGVLDGTYIFVLPGSPGACKDAWDGILATQLDHTFRPCNFVELMPRLKED